MGGEDIQTSDHKTRVENRVVAMVTGISLAFGAWWLQNQYTATNRIRDMVVEYERAMDARYVHKDVFKALEERLDRVQKQLEDHREKMRDTTP